MSTALAIHTGPVERNEKIQPISVRHEAPTIELTPDKLGLLKQTICKGSTDDEFELFVHACRRTGLDPFMKQIHAVKRWDPKLKREVMTIQIGIDGFRLIAKRTGEYLPGQEPTFVHDQAGKIVSATAFVKVWGHDKAWHTTAATAYYDEYVQTRTDKESNTVLPVAMWAKMPRSQLAKCAEALALRKAFPADLSGIYSKEEMEQSLSEGAIDVTPRQSQGQRQQPQQQAPQVPRISLQQVGILDELIAEDKEFRAHLIQVLANNNIASLAEIPALWYNRVHEMVTQNNAKKEVVKPEEMVAPSVFDKE
jgi:phage recombination protein Bet